MPIPVISYIEPQNDNPNFGVAHDVDMMGGWRAVADTAARDAIYPGRRLAGMRVLVRDTGQVWELGAGLTNAEWALVGGSEGATLDIYVDPAGDDSASGDASNPIKTIYEAGQRALHHPFVDIYLSAGNHELIDFEPGYWGRRYNLLSSPGLIEVYGEHAVLDTFTVGSIVENAITAQGSPGWAVDEWVGSAIRYDPYGYPGAYWFWVLSNTADTLTVAITTSAISGASLPPPGVGSTLEIVAHTSKICSPPTNPYATQSQMTINSRVHFHEVHFDGAVNGGFVALNNWENGYCAITNCKFSDWGYAAFSFGKASVGGSLFDGCTWIAMACYGDFNFSRDTVFKNCGTAILTERNSTGYIGQGCSNWFISNDICLNTNSGGILEDKSVRVWVDNCNDYLQISGGFGVFEKSGAPLIAWPGHDTLTQSVIHLSTDAVEGIGLFNSDLHTLLPDASFLLVDGYGPLSLTDYVADGKDAVFSNNRKVSK